MGVERLPPLIHQLVRSQLERRKSDGTFRRLPGPPAGIDFSSNDYLGLRCNPAFQSHLADALSLEGALGAGGSRLLAGDSSQVHELEEYLGSYHAAKGLLFGSGYLANIGLLSALGQRAVTFIYDEEVHASIRDGIRMSQAGAAWPFRHNDLEHLEDKLRRSNGMPVVIIESLYSMRGDLAPIQEICDICARYQAAVIVDEAHATGIIGPGGRGLVAAHGLEQEVYARVLTFGKAIGAYGAVVLCSTHGLKELLINKARSFVYHTALPAINLQAIQVAYTWLQRHPEVCDTLWTNVRIYREIALTNLGQTGPEGSPIQPLRFGEADKAKEAANLLRAEGLDVRAIVAPTVRPGEEMLRISIHAFNARPELMKLVFVLGETLGTQDDGA